MKKVIISFLSVILMLSLVSCGASSNQSTHLSSTNSNPASPQQSTVPSSTHSEPTPPEVSEIPKIETSVRQPTFCVSYKDYITVLNPWLEYHGWPLLDIDNLPFYEVADERACSLNFETGFAFSFYTPLKSDEVTQIVCRLDLDAAEEYTQALFCDIAKATVYALDFDNAESILTTLDYSNITDGVANTVKKDLAVYSYEVKKNVVFLFIQAR